MAQTGSGQYTYELVPDFFILPSGEPFGLISRVAADSQDHIYVFQRKDPPVVIFDRDGRYLGAWGSGEITDPHGLKIVGNTVYTTDRSDSVAKSFTLDGKPLLELGQRGVHSDTGHVANWLAERAAGGGVAASAAAATDGCSAGVLWRVTSATAAMRLFMARCTLRAASSFSVLLRAMAASSSSE